ncbi:MAG: hypothetical protein KAV00_16840 [Phycisphaerae bacterium]|nr:hypothetical protein [Phycisphaerae bacterium]
MGIRQMHIGALLEEYVCIIDQADGAKPGRDGDFDWDQLAFLLEREAGWTANGAYAIIHVAREYGTFVLRNALALAAALGIEDGTSGL